MRTYYLFTIKKEYYAVYRKNPLALYKTLENLYKIKKTNLNYGITLYNQICDIIDVNRLKNYFSHLKVDGKNNKFLIKLNKELAILKLYHSCIICKSIKNYPSVFNVLNYYSRYIFICDFYNHDYFFLSKSDIYLSRQ